jgi:hypothetical protein
MFDQEVEQLWAEKREKERRIAQLELELDQARKVNNLKTFSKVVVLFWRIFFHMELFLLGKKYDRQPGGGHEARNQVEMQKYKKGRY